MPDLMRIEYLADHPEFILPLARWHHEQWAYLRPGDSVEARIARLRAACGHGEIPTIFVAFSEGMLLGSAMLVAHDMETRMELTPWLAGVFVGPDYRQRGVGSSLVGKVVECAAARGVERLHLYTPSAEKMYLRLGWSVLERTRYRGADVVVMSLLIKS
jgi:GNAT superfamily N-acetyltransferase